MLQIYNLTTIYNKHSFTKSITNILMIWNVNNPHKTKSKKKPSFFAIWLFKTFTTGNFAIVILHFTTLVRQT